MDVGRAFRTPGRELLGRAGGYAGPSIPRKGGLGVVAMFDLFMAIATGSGGDLCVGQRR
jgi:hypothetical protein